MMSTLVAPFALGALSFSAQPATDVWVGIQPATTAPFEAYDTFSLDGWGQLVVAAQPLSAQGRWVRIPAGGHLHFVDESSGVALPRGARRLAGSGGRSLVLTNARTAAVLESTAGLFVIPVHAQLGLHGTVAPAAPMNFRPAPQQPKVDIDTTALDETLNILAGVKPVPATGELIANRSTEAGRTATRTFLQNALTALGLETRTLCYEYPVWGRKKIGCNVEATRWGADTTRAVLFTAHYDSVTTAAADDNASGTAAVLEVARILASGAEPQTTVRFVMFDQEEIGLVGSRAYVGSLTSAGGPAIAGVYNLDMLGWDKDDDGAIHVIDCKRAESTPLTAAVQSTIRNLGIALHRTEACTDRSDHGSFWSKGIPAVIVSENFFGNDENPCYHRSCDTVANMNMGYFHKITTLMANIGQAAAFSQAEN